MTVRYVVERFCCWYVTRSCDLDLCWRCGVVVKVVSRHMGRDVGSSVDCRLWRPT